MSWTYSYQHRKKKAKHYIFFHNKYTPNLQQFAYCIQLWLQVKVTGHFLRSSCKMSVEDSGEERLGPKINTTKQKQNKQTKKQKMIEN